MKVDVSRSDDPKLIETILRRDYFDPPVRDFPRAVVRTLSHEWIPSSPFVYVYVATAQDQYVGFIFAHTRGPALWREFARRYITRHPLGLGLTWWRMRVQSRLARRHSRAAARRDEQTPLLPLVETGSAFRWTPATGQVGYVDLVFVSPQARGHDCARQLLTAATTGMTQDGVKLVEAHIDAMNYASMRAFSKSGWELFRTRDGDVYARFMAEPSGQPRSTERAAR